jgi:hypothetical protein
MSQHASLATEAAKTAAGRNLVDYITGIFAHVNGAYEQHTQVLAGTSTFYVSNPPADDPTRPRHSFGRTLQIMSTLPGVSSNTDYMVVLPVFVGTTVPSVSVGPPEIEEQSVSQTIIQGSSVVLSVVASGIGPLVYQWRKDGINLSGATGTSLAITNISSEDGGDYVCIVANAGGSVSAQTITLTYAA